MPKVHVWLLLDPHPNSRAAPRIAVQDYEPRAEDFPPGHGPGIDWEVRELDVDKGTYTRLLTASLSPEAQQATHARWWDEADPAAEPFEEVWDRQVQEVHPHPGMGTAPPLWAETVTPDQRTAYRAARRPYAGPRGVQRRLDVPGGD